VGAVYELLKLACYTNGIMKRWGRSVLVKNWERRASAVTIHIIQVVLKPEYFSYPFVADAIDLALAGLT